VATIRSGKALPSRKSKPIARKSKLVTKIRAQSAIDVETTALLEHLLLLDQLLERKRPPRHSKVLVDYQRIALKRLSALAGHPTAFLLKSEPSGSDWVKKFPDSKSTADLAVAFRGGVDGFIASMKAGGVAVAIGTTLRPPERAYLMHWAWMIAKAGTLPADVPAMTGVDIEWDHGDAAASKQAALDMVNAYAIVAKPALDSRHTQGRAIDMTISWSGTATLKDKAGKDIAISSTPRNGENTDLVAVGATYAVVKATFAGDPPHWSDDGH
jgi:hypothetical protein